MPQSLVTMLPDGFQVLPFYTIAQNNFYSEHISMFLSFFLYTWNNKKENILEGVGERKESPV